MSDDLFASSQCHSPSSSDRSTDSSDTDYAQSTDESEDLKADLLYLEADDFLKHCSNNTDAAGIVGALVHLREEQRRLKEMSEITFLNLQKASREILQASTDILLELKKRPAVEPAIAPKRAKKLPAECSSTIRLVHQKLVGSEGNGYCQWNFEEGFDSPGNTTITDKLVEEIRQLYQEKWAEGTLRDAAKRYFITSSEAQKRATTGVADDHRRRSRRNQRVTQKMTARMQALEALKLNSEQKQRYHPVINEKGYHSSEHSEADSEPEEGNTGQEEAGTSHGHSVKIAIRRLTWERTELKNLKVTLDSHHQSHLTKRARTMVAERRRVGTSTRPLPKHAAKNPWAVRLPTVASKIAK